MRSSVVTTNNRSLALEDLLVPLQHHRDARGALVALERGTIPFAPVRTFVIFDVPSRQTRAGHAVSCDEFFWVPSGSCRLTIDDGVRKSSTILRGTEYGVLIPAGLWTLLSEFAPSTLVVVMAAKPYAETQSFDAPQPDLLAARNPARDPAG
jgi:hypothetical protein